MSLKPKQEVIRELFEMKQIRLFRDIFGMWNFPKATLVKGARLNHYKLTDAIEDPRTLTNEQVERVANYFGVPLKDIEATINAQILEDRLPPPAKSKKPR